MPLPSWLVFAVAFLPLPYYNEAKLKGKNRKDDDS